MQEKLRPIPDGWTFYLYHGIYYPHKLSKLRVMFDCSTELNGRSINKELLPGPNLANQLVGALIKFWENKVAFMADIKKICIFKCLLLSIMEFCFIFLWKEGNNSNKPTDYEIYIHVFEEAPYGVCSNYALKIAAIENKDKFQEQDVQTCKTTFVWMICQSQWRMTTWQFR